MTDASPNDTRLLRQALVCHADILGWSQRSLAAIENGTAEDFIEGARAALDEAYGWIRRDPLEGMLPDQVPPYEIRTLTDNIVVAHQMHSPGFDAGEPEFGSMMFVFQMYQALLASKGFPVRGAIAAGLHYMDKDFAFGDALVEAVGAERSGAPPRIVLAPSVVDLLERQLRFYSGGIEDTPHYEALLVDNDGEIFLDYLSVAFMAVPDGPVWTKLLVSHKRAIESALSDTTGDPRVHEKYRWMAGYHNLVCSTFVETAGRQCTGDEGFDAALATEAEKVEALVVENTGFPQPRRLSEKDRHPETRGDAPNT